MLSLSGPQAEFQKGSQAVLWSRGESDRVLREWTRRLGLAALRRYRRRTRIFGPGGTGACALLVARGVAGIRRPEERTDALLMLAYPGQLIYDPGASREAPFVVTTLSDCEAFRIEGRTLEEAAKKDAEISAMLLRALHAEIQRRTAMLAEFLTLSPAERLQRRCAEFAAVLGAELQPGRLPIGHEDLATLLGLSGRQLRGIQAQISLSQLNPRRSSAAHR